MHREESNVPSSAPFQPTPLAGLFPGGDYQFQIRFTRGEPAAFFGPTVAHPELIAQRQHWLRTSPDLCAAWRSEGEPLLNEVIEFAESWHRFANVRSQSPWERLLALGEFWEPDFLLLKTGDDGEIRLLGGCVCFPSSWRLGEKLGHPIEFIHRVVPGLNAGLGQAIHTFLAKLKPGIAWQRFNWGLSRSPELNQHPDRGLRPLDASVRLEDVWLRVEDQALVALPKSGGILFGIRIVNRSLAEVTANPVARTGLSRALETMPDAMAHYKNLATARERILGLLRDVP